MHVMQTLAHIFPPPHFMTLPAAGVDISDGSLKYILFAPDGTGLRLVSSGDIDIPDGAVRRGRLEKKEALVQVLRELRKRLPTPFVRVSLPEERAYLFETLLEKVSHARDIRSMLEVRLEENVPIAPRDAHFDYTILRADPATGEVEVAVAVYAKETVDGYYAACREAELVPLAFEVEAQAIARAVVAHEVGETVMLVDFGQTRTGVGVVYKDTLVFTSTIDIGGIHLSEALRKQLGDVEERELTRIKNEQGLLRIEDRPAVQEALLSAVAAMKDELYTRMSYWNMRGESTDDRMITKVILCGGSCNLAGLPEYLSEELGVPVERGSVWRNAFSVEDSIPPIPRRHSYGFATAIGLALSAFMNHDQSHS